MKIITEPSLVLVGRPQLDNLALQEYLKNELDSKWYSDSENDGEAIAETAGRICYLSFNNPRPGGNKAYLEHIIEVQHGSVLSHSSYNFIISGISRALSHELVRHNIGCGISQLSQRYVDESVAEYVCPQVIKDDPILYDKWYDAVINSHVIYVALVDMLSEKIKLSSPSLTKTEQRKIARQAARSVLPNATETKLFWTANLRAVRNIIEQRASKHADTEIRKFANKLYDIMVVECPNVFSDYEVIDLGDGTRDISTKNRKV